MFGSALSVWRDPRAPQVGFSWLDVKLGTRMLLKQPALTGVAVFTLAASAIYATMSFAVTQRTREIGIRAGCGQARPHDHAPHRGPARPGGPVRRAAGDLPLHGPQQASDLLALLPGILAVLGIGALACADPARRALRIAPTEALRDG